MIELFYANRLDALAAALSQQLNHGLSPLDALFAAPVVIIPNREVEVWLRLELARLGGIAASLQTELIYAFLSQLITKAELDLEVLTGDHLMVALLELLVDHPQDGGALGAYLERAQAHPQRIVHLAKRLGAIFYAYVHHRSQLIDQWAQERHLLPSHPAAKTEEWQRALWLQLIEGRDFVRINRLFQDPPAALVQALPPVLYLFAPDTPSRAEIELFAQLSRFTRVVVLALNPCLEYWEDLPNRSKQRQALDLPGANGAALEPLPAPSAPLSPLALSEGGDAPLLALWGKPGRELTRALNQLTDCDFHPCFLQQPAQSLLQQLQYDILNRSSAAEISARRAGRQDQVDDSLSIFACPSVQRECELVANAIWQRMVDQPELKFDDFQVLVPHEARQSYLIRLRTAFQLAHDLPAHFIDDIGGPNARVIEAIELLLNLPLSRFTRQDLLPLITHPNFNSPDAAAPGHWERWCDELGIVHGIDHSDHAATYIKDDLFNWSQGLTRLNLGLFISPPPSLIATPPAPYLLHELAIDDMGAVAALSLTVRSLAADARYARRAQLAPARWALFFQSLVNTYIAAETEADRRAIDLCLKAFQEISEISDPKATPIPMAAAHELFVPRLQSLEQLRGRYRPEGVKVSALLSGRPLPAKISYIVGLSEGIFPAADPRAPLDLRQAIPHASDLSPRERDRYTFLGQLLASSDKLTLSYVDRDDQSGEALAPSSIIDDLLDVLDHYYFEGNPRNELVQRFPLRRHQPGPHGEALPHLPCVAEEEQAALLRSVLATDPNTPPPPERIAQLPKGQRSKLNEILGHHSLPALPSAQLPSELSLTKLVAFLRSPLQASAQAALDMRWSRKSSTLGVKEEPYSTQAQTRRALLADVFFEAFNHPQRLQGKLLDQLYQERVDFLTHAGHFPYGAFGAAQRRSDLGVLETWRSLFKRSDFISAPALIRYLFGARRLPFAPHTLGRDQKELDSAIELPALQLELEGAPLALTGLSIPMSAANERMPECFTSLTLSAELRKADFLAPYVQHLALCAAGQSRPRVAWIFGTTNDNQGAARIQLAATPQLTAIDILEELAHELLCQSHDYLLPIEDILQFHEGQKRARAKSANLTQIIQSNAGNYFQPSSDHFGPVRRLERFGPPADAEAKMRRRLSPFLDALRTFQHLGG